MSRYSIRLVRFADSVVCFGYALEVSERTGWEDISKKNEIGFELLAGWQLQGIEVREWYLDVLGLATTIRAHSYITYYTLAFVIILGVRGVGEP